MRYAVRRGSFRCMNTQCPFRVQFGVTNTKQFKNGSNNEQVCSICGDAGEFVICSARCYMYMYIRYSKKEYRCFISCPITPRPEKQTECVKEMIKKHPHLKPVGIQSAFVMSLFPSHPRMMNICPFNQ